MRDDIGIHPLDCIADVGRDLLRRIRDLLNPDIGYLGTR
jgi:hypothetical protein